MCTGYDATGLTAYPCLGYELEIRLWLLGWCRHAFSFVITLGSSLGLC